jgi:hypothetical protein
LFSMFSDARFESSGGKENSDSGGVVDSCVLVLFG